MAVHAEPVHHDDVAALVRVLSRLRWRLGIQRSMLFGVRGVMGSAVVVIGVSVAAWLMSVEIPMGLVGLPLLAALVLAGFRWPSDRTAALAADRRLGLQERLTTAVELARRPRVGRFDGLQVRDAVERATAAPSTGWLAVDGDMRRDGWLALGLLVLAAGSLLLPGLPRPGSAVADQADLAAAAAQSAAEEQRAILPDTPDLAVAQPQPVQTARTNADLATRVQQEQAEQSALDQLSQALGSVSAGQPAADAIQQGDFSGARDQLANLGEEADQLSDAAKQQLAKSLQQAAGATSAADRQLADRERQAAQALGRNNYTEQRQALRGLADQVQRSGERSVTPDQLARDVGQLQQQSGASQGASARAQGSGPASPSDAAGGQQGQAGAQGQGGSAAGQQGGPGVGDGASSDLLGDTPSRLDSAGQTVQVPNKLGSGPGVRPADGTEDQTGVDPSSGARSVAELQRAQETGQVTPEQNLVPGEQRPIVRGYFR